MVPQERDGIAQEAVQGLDDPGQRFDATPELQLQSAADLFDTILFHIVVFDLIKYRSVHCCVQQGPTWLGLHCKSSFRKNETGRRPQTSRAPNIRYAVEILTILWNGEA